MNFMIIVESFDKSHSTVVYHDTTLPLFFGRKRSKLLFFTINVNKLIRGHSVTYLKAYLTVKMK